MSFGTGIQSRVTGLLARGQTLDGRQVAVSSVEYSSEIAGLGASGVSVDVGGDTVIGFASLVEARDYLTTFDVQEYSTFDNMGRKTTETRTGLGIPDGMIRWAKSTADDAPSGPTGATGTTGATGAGATN